MKGMDMNILIIDNKKFLAENLTHFLREVIDINVQYTTRGNTALKLLSQKHFDLVISELWLPDSQSDDWLLEIGKLNTNQILIVISSYPRPINLDLCDKLNIIGYFETPFDVKIISNLISQLNKQLN
jgi:DNA-binding NtrC family response regulator